MVDVHPPHADELELVSMYLHTPVSRAHGIALRLGPDVQGHREGTLSFDPNSCDLDTWGDRTRCTEMGIRVLRVETTCMRTLDLAGHHRVLHSMASPEFDREQVSLIEYPSAGLWYMVLEHEENGTWVVPLFSAPLFRPDPAGTIAMRYGVPMREMIERGDVDEMKREAKLVRDALAALPTRARSQHVAEVTQALGELENALAELER